MRSRRSVLAAGATGTLALSAGCLGFVLGNEPLDFTAARAAPTDVALEETGYDEVESNHETIEETIEVGVSREVRASFWVVTYSKEIDLREVMQNRLAEAELDEVEAEHGEPTDESEGEGDDDVSDDDVPDDVSDDDVPEEVSDDDLPEEVGDEFDEADLEAFESQEAAFFAVLSMPSMEVLGRSLNPLEGMGSEALVEELSGQSGDDVELDDVEHRRSSSLPILGSSRDVDVFGATTEVEGEAFEIELSIASFEHEDDYLVIFGGYPAELEAEGDDLERLFESVEHPLD